MLLQWCTYVLSQTNSCMYKQYNTFNLPADHLIDWYLIFI